MFRIALSVWLHNASDGDVNSIYNLVWYVIGWYRRKQLYFLHS